MLAAKPRGAMSSQPSMGPPNFSLYSVEKVLLQHGSKSPADKFTELTMSLFAEADSASVGCVEDAELIEALLASKVFRFTPEQISDLLACVQPVTTGFVCDDEFGIGFKKYIHRTKKQEMAGEFSYGVSQPEPGDSVPSPGGRRPKAVRMSIDSARPILYHQKREEEASLPESSGSSSLWPSHQLRNPVFQDGFALSGSRRKTQETSSRRGSMDPGLDQAYRRRHAMSTSMPEIPEIQDNPFNSFASASPRNAIVTGGPSRRGPRERRSVDLPRPDPHATSTLRNIVSRFPPISNLKGSKTEKRIKSESGIVDSIAKRANSHITGRGGRRSSIDENMKEIEAEMPKTETDRVAGFIKGVIGAAHDAKPKAEKRTGHYYVRGEGGISNTHHPKMVRSQSMAHYLKAFEGMSIAKDGTVKMEEFMKHVREHAPALADHAMNMYEVLQRRSKKKIAGDGLDFTALLSVLFPSATERELDSLLKMCRRKSDQVPLEAKASMLNKLQLAQEIFEGWNVAGSGFLSRREAERGQEEDGMTELNITDLFGLVGTSTQRDYVQFEDFYQWYTKTDLKKMRSMAGALSGV